MESSKRRREASSGTITNSERTNKWRRTTERSLHTKSTKRTTNHSSRANTSPDKTNSIERWPTHLNNCSSYNDRESYFRCKDTKKILIATLLHLKWGIYARSHCPLQPKLKMTSIYMKSIRCIIPWLTPCPTPCRTPIFWKKWRENKC